MQQNIRFEPLAPSISVSSVSVTSSSPLVVLRLTARRRPSTPAPEITTRVHSITTGSSCLMQISLLRILLLRFFKTITKIWLMPFYGLLILLLRT